MTFKTAFAAGAVGMLAGVGPYAAKALEHTQFRCRVGGYVSVVQIIPEEGRAAFEAAGVRFSLAAHGQGTYANEAQAALFESAGKGATLRLGDVAHSCEPARRLMRPASEGQLGQATTRRINVVGQSFGGKLREGPGREFSQIGNVSEGTWLTILNNTGIRFEGYDWFEVVFDTGTRGYQWGGIMCSNGPRIEGIYNSCQAVHVP